MVIPAYNEEPRIGGTLEQVIGFLSARHYSWEVLVADDGSTDETGRLVAGVAALHPNLRLISLSHRGKGWAVQNAMLAAQGEYRLLCDADLSVPIEQIERFIPPQLEEVDIAIGSRETGRCPSNRRAKPPARDGTSLQYVGPPLGSPRSGGYPVRFQVLPRGSCAEVVPTSDHEWIRF